MDSLPPWVQGPFELIVHAEEHLRRGEDFDRRLSLISFDNAVEVAIATYLSLNPIHRGGRSYPKDLVTKWLDNYHTKLEFLEAELASRKLSWEVQKTYIIYAHDQRNKQYHEGSKGTPEKNVLEIIRKSALWIVSILYDIQDIEKVLNETIDAKLPIPQLSPQPDESYDQAIDDLYGMVEVGGQVYFTSEILFALDEVLYRAVGEELITKQLEGEANQ